MALPTATLALATHAFFFREGDAFTQPEAGTCARESKPGADDEAWLSLGTIETAEDSISDEEEKTVWAPVPGHLVKKDIITTKQGLTIKLTSNELTPLAVEAFYRTSQDLDSESDQFNPLSAVPRKGWLKLQRYDQDDVEQFVIDLWGRLKVTGGFKGGGGELVAPEFEFETLYSTLNTAAV